MSVLRIKEIADELLEKDPYELFTLDEPHRMARGLRPGTWGAAFGGVLLAFGVAFYTFYNTQGAGKDADKPFAYFEVKAIDPDGRPVAGATVKDGEKQLGLTDSFGEWRRFMHVKPGTTLALTLSKKVGQTQIAAVKNIAVPVEMPKNGDLELTGSVQLQRAGAKNALPAPIARHSKRPEPEDKTEAATGALSGGPSEARAASGASLTDETAAEKTAASASAYTSVWYVVDGKATQALSDVAAALRQRSRELGLAVEPASSWQVRLSDLATGTKAAGSSTEGHLIKVDGLLTDKAKGGLAQSSFSYLRNYGESPALTARDILWTAKAHVAKAYPVTKRGGVWYLNPPASRLWTLAPGHSVFDSAGATYTVTAAGGDQLRLAAAGTEPCASGNFCDVTTAGPLRQAPEPGWQKLRLKVLGSGDPGLKLYVSGYEARQVQDKVFEYWGAPLAAVNVTAVRGGRLIFRRRIQTGGNSLPVVSLPSAVISRR